MTEYKTTTKAVAEFYSIHGERLPEQPVAPPGEGWELKDTAANQNVVFYTWKRTSTLDLVVESPTIQNDAVDS